MKICLRPVDHVVVDEFAAVIQVQPGDFWNGIAVTAASQCAEDVDVGVVTHRLG